MVNKSIAFRIREELLETSSKLKNLAFKEDFEDEELLVFKLPVKSNTAWHSFIYEIGVIRAKRMLEKFKEKIEEE